MLAVRKRLLALSPLWLAASAMAQEPKATPDNGTDPTRLSPMASISWEKIDMAKPEGMSSGTFYFKYALPITAARRTNLVMKLPVVSQQWDTGNDTQLTKDMALGDISFKINHVFDLNKARGIVFGAELITDTAQEASYGSAQYIVKGSFTYAMFLPNRAIFAPVVQHGEGFGGDADVPRYSTTLIDFYYVPKLSNPNVFMTLDPSVSANWHDGTYFAGLGVTLGRSVGKLLGGDAKVTIKPSFFIGADRGSDWSIELGLKLLNF